MVRELPDFPACFFDASLQPRTIQVPVYRGRSPDPSFGTRREEQAAHALDVFDRTVKRTERLVAHLRCNGYDITTVSDNLRQLEDIRGDLTRAFVTPGQDLRRHLQNVFEVRVVGLCSAISSLKNDESAQPGGHYQEHAMGNDTAFSLMAGDYLSSKCDGA